MRARRWLSEKVAEWVLTGLLGVAWAVVLAFLRHHESAWASPLLYGTVGAVLIWVCGAVWILVSRVPKIRTKVTVGNIEENVRSWLDRSGSSVKTEVGPDVFFRFTAKLPGGTSIIVWRPRNGLTGHVIVRADIVNEKAVPKELQAAPTSDQERLFELIKLELARAKVGYAGLIMPINQQFSIAKSIRITDHLSEEDFMKVVWDVEAAVHATLAVYQLWLKALKR